MPRRVLETYGFEPAKQPCLRKSKLEPKGKCGAAIKKQPKEQPVEQKNPLHFLHQNTDGQLVVHWTRISGSTQSPIKLLPPW
ncbi:uncharacterized protein LOC6729946 [Drosophila simulans]|uniref:GD18023 n=1 Tax=Drosophila simulans TaxID=7240 RepID=B4QYS5_DROSI|nr:uncharacterized protein LOC6729946 [Drosophila simulans]EDX14744.1 GD18023 [Drosophila simulans]KMZ06451.1 uncharacterized protein Dsimw501_GD18023 [Drosophila simulans]